MGYEAYLFVAFVGLVLFAVLYLNHMFKKARSEDGTQQERERKLYVLYQNLDEEMLAMDGDLRAAREETDQKLRRMEDALQRMEFLSASLKTETEDIRKELQASLAQLQSARAEIKDAPKKEERRMVRKRPQKAEQVQKMLSEGMDADEVARTLGISRGEVELIMGLAK